jgi:hypothetical protein
MSSTNEEIKVPENLERECFTIYSGVLTHSKKQTLRKLIRHAYLAGTKHDKSTNEAN